MNKLILVKIDLKYCNYLRKFDAKVPYNYDQKESRPFVGVLFSVNKYKYFAPLSSPKLKHRQMKNTIDFFKLNKGLLGTINFNNMLPVTNNVIIKIDLNKDYIAKKDIQYNKLLKEQIYWLNRNSEKLYNKSKKLYDKYCAQKLNPSIAKRCCDFKLLEEKCKEYSKLQASSNIDKPKKRV